MEFIETSVFTKALHTLLTDDEYRLLQNTLWRDPLVGDVVRGGGGIRKTHNGVRHDSLIAPRLHVRVKSVSESVLALEAPRRSK
jgi:hypothetical protein